MVSKICQASKNQNHHHQNWRGKYKIGFEPLIQTDLPLNQYSSTTLSKDVRESFLVLGKQHCQTILPIRFNFIFTGDAVIKQTMDRMADVC